MSVTLEEVWALFKETDRKFQETDRQFKETDRKFQETDRQFKETDRKFQETDRQFKETDRKFQETDRKFQETSRSIKKLEELFTSQWGKLMESLVEGDLVAILNQRGIAIQDTTTRLKGKLPDGGGYEFDIIAHNGEAVVIIEVKTTLRPKDITHFIDKLNHFKTWVPRYRHNILHGGVAWLSADAEAAEMATKRGLFSIRATGDSAAIQNPPAFIPRAW